jgi:hypothetical protein
VSTHYPNLSAGFTAACDVCGGPARLAASRFQAYRHADGWVFLCPACVPEHHAAYAATRIGRTASGSVRTSSATELSIRYPADRPKINDRIRRR